MNILCSLKRPLAITMWDFSWLERRFEGGGYEDWEKAVTELEERGYDAIRLDVFPHMIYRNPHGVFRLDPVWPPDYASWGTRETVYIENIEKKLTDFVKVCSAHGIKLGLSTWFRDSGPRSTVRSVDTPKTLAQMFIRATETVLAAGGEVLYVDFCNEFAHWADFVRNEDGSVPFRDGDLCQYWIHGAINEYKKTYPDIPLTFSVSTEFDRIGRENLEGYGLYEPHIWMNGDGDGRFTAAFAKVRRDGTPGEIIEQQKELYLKSKKYWQHVLTEQIRYFAEFSKETGLPLITTECWGVIDCMDRPGTDWSWIKELCEIGVKTASQTGRWAAIATNNFCGPQFPSLWNDIEWHKKMTGIIHSGALNYK
ncbi:MAG: hypothetical protein II777_09555 [Clostridia bacterium]|nr:hypothetical protein [Clostridia bacterium]